MSGGGLPVILGRCSNLGSFVNNLLNMQTLYAPDHVWNDGHYKSNEGRPGEKQPGSHRNADATRNLRSRNKKVVHRL